MKQTYYLVESDNAPQPDKSFSLKEVKKLLEYTEQLNFEYEVYLCVWDNLEDEFDLKLNVTEQFN
ncbi:hypothetical protein elemo19C_phanotate37 [Flavobacterium phage vB_FspP_elemoA_1-9C]|jgi:hypothetical protein|uniref:Uncharacterized protein n=6 Tax=Elemovirus TaxID=2948694 RepID=A0A7D7FR03_9CAUD|nr:hypothetical protein KNV10_gp75 [Flavobacterium phage vB_FspP_elemoA_7-9A]YP_010108941.1 hypothetical protein KNV11_gp72 [Flavobacterium phage vB_FspP_elemoF_6-3D]YP_010109029.1 hypothetical protein KNV12_gp72 [Flavobacterium phage vB_FspP_elemoE_6-9C]YP_010109123.1 hypothetical protein KNV13_gp40 [Flavobacterium phage vB_FspP_elemoD_13-5B]YP_010356112.1 hypothetical protein M1M19_gp77 [Flavobacterium phage vB_FspP_elemoB_14-3B]YP_010356474.1 hypothetical protein M1M21_gp74 [Flavobacterium 